MFAELLKTLWEMTLEKRCEAVMAELQKPSWSPDEHARLTLLLVHDLRLLRRPTEVVANVDREVDGPCSDKLKSRLLEFRALVEIDRADDVGALATLVEMERCGISEVQLPVVYGIRGMALSFQGDESGFGWLKQARDAFLTAGNQENADTVAIWAALLLVDTGRSASEWIELISASNPYRLAMEAELALSTGDAETMQGLIEAVLTSSKSESHACARATFVRAIAAYPSMAERAAYLAEQAMTLATSRMEGYEPRLIERIRRFKLMCEEGIECAG